MGNHTIDGKYLGKLKKQELVEIAKYHGLTGYSKLKKDDLVKRLLETIDLKEAILLEDKLLEYCKSAMFLYGVINKETLLGLYNYYETNKVFYLQIEHWITKGNFVDSDFVYRDGYIISNWLKEDNLWKSILEIQAKYAFYVPTKKEDFLYYGKAENQVPGKIYNELRAYLRTDKKLSEYYIGAVCNIVNDLIFADYQKATILEKIVKLQMGSTYLFKTRQDIKLLSIYIDKIMQNTRLIRYRGHTAIELGLIKGDSIIGPLRKFYPNDRCPCGSGKKYKICCGRI